MIIRSFEKNKAYYIIKFENDKYKWTNFYDIKTHKIISSVPYWIL